MQEQTFSKSIVGIRGHKRSPRPLNYKSTMMNKTLITAGVGLVFAMPCLAGTTPSILMHSGMVIRCESFVGQNEKKSKHDPQIAKYDATPGYVIVSYYPNVIYAIGNTTWSLSNVQANSSVMTSQQLSTSYQYAYSQLANLNIPSVVKADILVDLNGSWSFNQSTLNQLQSSNAGLILQTDAWGAGPLTFKGKNNIAVEIWDIKEMEIPACFRSEAAMKVQLKADIDAAYKKWKLTHKWYPWLTAVSAMQFGRAMSGLARPVSAQTQALTKASVAGAAGEGLGSLPALLSPRAPSPKAANARTVGSSNPFVVEVQILPVAEAEKLRAEIAKGPVKD